jgi:acyl dehydratase
MAQHHVDGPYFEDFSVGQTFAAPAVTVTEGLTALYQAIIGDRLRLPLDHVLSQAVTGEARVLVHPMLVVNLINGQTTFASQNVKGNLFYRGLLLHRPVFVGDTLTTTTKVVGLRQNTVKPGRDATGMVALEIDTHNQRGEQVLHYWRCPMIACRDPQAATGHDDTFDWIPERIADADILAVIPSHWRIDALAPERYPVPAPHLAPGDRVTVGPQDTVTAAPELVRMTGNIAYTHTDASRSYLGRRLVYGGHTISLVLAHITRALPHLITLLAWQGCDHLGPVLEDDILRSEFTLTSEQTVALGGCVLELHATSFARRRTDDGTAHAESKVLDWRLVVWTA